MLLRPSCLAAVLACSFPLSAWSQNKPAEPGGAPPPAAPASPAADFGDLIRQLDSDKFAERQTAGQIQIQVQAGGVAGPGGFKRMHMKNVNGVKEIEVDDNGKKVKIVDDPNNGIKVEVTEKNKEGKEETKKYEAKNADELKKNHPE